MHPCWIKVFLSKTNFTDPPFLYISALLSYQSKFDMKNRLFQVKKQEQ